MWVPQLSVHPRCCGSSIGTSLALGAHGTHQGSDLMVKCHLLTPLGTPERPHVAAGPWWSCVVRRWVDHGGSWSNTLVPLHLYNTFACAKWSLGEAGVIAQLTGQVRSLSL